MIVYICEKRKLSRRNFVPLAFFREGDYVRDDLGRGDLVLFKGGSDAYVLYSFLYSELRGEDVLGVCLSDERYGGSRRGVSGMVRVYIGLIGRELLLSRDYLEKMKG